MIDEDEARMRETEQLNGVRLENRMHQSHRFVQAIEDWIALWTRNVNDLASCDVPREVAFASKPAVDKLTVKVKAYRDAALDDDQLLAAEDVADMIRELVGQQELRTRTPPVDAFESFYEMGQSDRDCTDCGKRPPVVFFSAAAVCVHCHLGIHS